MFTTHREVIDEGGMITRGLIAYWPASEGAGDTIFDSSGNGHDLIIKPDIGASWDGPPIAPGSTSSFFSNGSTRYAITGTNAQLGVSTAMTAIAWVNRAVYQDDKYIISIWDYTNGKRAWSIRTQDTGNNNVYSWAANVTSTGASSPAKNYAYAKTGAPGAWDGNNHMLAITFDSGALKLYEDGVEVTPTTIFADDSFTSILNYPGPVIVGAAGNATGQGGFCNMYQNGLRYHNVALTPAEILSIYNGTG